MTFFSVFDVPVFWPILLCYWIVLFVLTMKRQIMHMIKYKYVPFSFGKQVSTLQNIIHSPSVSCGTMNFIFCETEGSWHLLKLLTIVPFHHLSVIELLAFLVVGRGIQGSIPLPVAVALRTGTEASSYDNRGQREQTCSFETVC